MKFLTSIFLLTIFSLIVFSLLTTAQILWTFGAHQHDDYVSHRHTTTLEGDLADFSDEDVSDLVESLRGDPHDWDNDHSDVGKQSTSHSHEVRHQHDDYVSHTHTVTHSHARPDDIHSDPHDWDNDHSRTIVINPVEKSITLGPHQHDDYVSHTHTVKYSGNIANIPSDPHEGSPDHSNVDRTTGGPQPPQLQRQPQQRSHSHEVAHQHGSYVSHTHTVTHTGDASPHTHTYTESETHSLSGGNHVGVDTKQPNNQPPGNNQPQPQPQSHSHSITHQHGSYVSHTHTVTHTGDASPHTHTYTESETHSLSGGNHVGVDTKQPTNNQPPGNNQGNSPPPGNNPSPAVEEGGTPAGTTTTTVATPVVGGTPEGTSSPQQVVSSGPQETQSGAPLARLPLQPLRVTEYMVRDWSKGGVWSGNSNLPQWIELYNPNTEAINLKGYTFQYATRRFANDSYTLHTLTLASAEDDTDGFVVAGEGVAILVTHDVRSRRFSGIEATQVYNLDIENVLKRGWVLTDADGEEVHRLGRAAFSALRDPAAPPHQDGSRVAYQVYKSESPSEPYYYGHSEDIGSPGFYKQPPPAAPSKSRRKQVGTWASLKQTP